MSDLKTTPMLEQYLAIKANYPDAILMYRMGDFFEFFFEDAEIVARELQITLTCRNHNADYKMPMAGFPHTAAISYVQQLLDKGYNVVKCDQMEPPTPGKGLVRREVTRIFTPGTMIEESSLGDSLNLLAAIFWNPERKSGALCWADISTGNWSGLQDNSEEHLWQWALKMEPREIILPDGYNPPKDNQLDQVKINHVPAAHFFDLSTSRDKILNAQSVKSLSALDLEGKSELIQACGAILTYLLQTLRQENLQLEPFKAFVPGRYLILDEVTQRNLEIFRTMDGRRGQGTLKHVLDRTITPMGGRLLEEMLRNPWLEEKKILLTQEAVNFFFQHEPARKHLRAILKQIFDLERLYRRIELNQCAPKDFVALRQSLLELPNLRLLLENSATTEPPPTLISDVLKRWDNLSDCGDLLQRAMTDNPPLVFTEGGLFKPGYNAELDELLELAERGQDKIEDLLKKEQGNLGMPRLKTGYNRVFGYYFEIPKSLLEKIPPHFERRQSLANAERFTTGELMALENRLIEADEKRRQLEYALFVDLREQIAKQHTRIMYMAEVLAGLDYWQSLAEAATQWNWNKPTIYREGPLIIAGGRHPVVEAIIGPAHFIANDLHLDKDCRIMLITGPNMTGKSTILRQTALICILAQIGSFVPAEKASLGLVDRIFSRVGASDNLARGLSTFMVEMTETARILRQLGRRSLIILDEIGRGTSTFDGMAIAQAVIEELARKNAPELKVLFATHYLELTALAKILPGVRNFNIGVIENNGEIIFMHRLLPGPADKSYGVEVARLAGIPKPVVQRARQLLETMRQGSKNDPAAQSAQVALPGLAPTKEKKSKHESDEEPQPFIAELAAIKLDSLTPLEALNLLGKWKNELGENLHAPK